MGVSIIKKIIVLVTISLMFVTGNLAYAKPSEPKEIEPFADDWYVTPEDIKAVGFDVMRHRVLLTYEAEAESVNSETVLNTIFEAIEVP